MPASQFGQYQMQLMSVALGGLCVVSLFDTWPVKFAFPSTIALQVDAKLICSNAPVVAVALPSVLCAVTVLLELTVPVRLASPSIFNPVPFSEYCLDLFLKS